MRIGQLLAVSVSTVILATSAAAALPAGYKQKADALLARSYAADGPGAQVVISEGGRIVYQGHRGLADVAAKRPIDADTLFRIGSITKQFSAAVLLQLVAEGKLSLDDPLTKHLPDYPNGGAITVRQLLNHTSGIQSYTAIPGWMAGDRPTKAYTTDQLIAEFKDLPAPEKPGATFQYNNSGYILVGALIERVTGKPWIDEVERRIAAPLGLSTIEDGTRESGLPAMAKGYTNGEGGVAPSRAIHMSVPGAAGALIGNAGDLAKWAHALHHGKVLPAPIYAQMIAPTRLANGRVEQYGFGIGQSSFRGTPAIGHSGGIFGFASDSLYIPQSDMFITILTNSDSARVSQGAVMRRLAALAIGKPFPEMGTVPYSAEEARAIEGVYRFDDGTRTIVLREGKLHMIRNEGEQREVFAAGSNRYHFGEDGLSWIDFKRDAAGKPVMAFHANGDDVALLGTHAGPPPAQAPTVAVPDELLAAYAGSYTAPIGKVTIARSADGLTVQLAGQPAIAMRPVAPDQFAVDRVNARVRFVSTAGKVTGLEIDQGGRKLPATRD